MTTGISFTFEHRGTTYKYDGRQVSNDEFSFIHNGFPIFGPALYFIGDLDDLERKLEHFGKGWIRYPEVQHSFHIEEDRMIFYVFSVYIGDERQHGGDLNKAFEEAFKKHWSSKISKKRKALGVDSVDEDDDDDEQTTCN